MAHSTGLSQAMNGVAFGYEDESSDNEQFDDPEVAAEDPNLGQEVARPEAEPVLLNTLPGSHSHVMEALGRVREETCRRGDHLIPLSARKAAEFVNNYILLNGLEEERENITGIADSFRQSSEAAFDESIQVAILESPDQIIRRLEARVVELEAERQGHQRIGRGARAHPYSRRPTREIRRSFCSFCSDRRHESADCRVFVSNMDRVDRLHDLNRCVRCLGRGHPAAECRKTIGNCPICQRRGHPKAICRQRNDQ